MGSGGQSGRLTDASSLTRLGVTLDGQNSSTSPTLRLSDGLNGRSSIPPGTQVDLSFAAMLADLKAPMLDQHDAYSDALMAAMAYVALRDFAERGIRIPRQPLRGARSFEVG